MSTSLLAMHTPSANLHRCVYLRVFLCFLFGRLIQYHKLWLAGSFNEMSYLLRIAVIDICLEGPE